MNRKGYWTGSSMEKVLEEVELTKTREEQNAVNKRDSPTNENKLTYRPGFVHLLKDKFLQLSTSDDDPKTNQHISRYKSRSKNKALPRFKTNSGSTLLSSNSMPFLNGNLSSEFTTNEVIPDSQPLRPAVTHIPQHYSSQSSLSSSLTSSGDRLDPGSTSRLLVRSSSISNDRAELEELPIKNIVAATRCLFEKFNSKTTTQSPVSAKTNSAVHEYSPVHKVQKHFTPLLTPNTQKENLPQPQLSPVSKQSNNQLSSRLVGNSTIQFSSVKDKPSELKAEPNIEPVNIKNTSPTDISPANDYTPIHNVVAARKSQLFANNKSNLPSPKTGSSTISFVGGSTSKTCDQPHFVKQPLSNTSISVNDKRTTSKSSLIFTDKQLAPPVPSIIGSNNQSVNSSYKTKRPSTADTHDDRNSFSSTSIAPSTITPINKINHAPLPTTSIRQFKPSSKSYAAPKPPVDDNKKNASNWNTWEDIPAPPKRKTFIEEARHIYIPTEELNASRKSGKSWLFTTDTSNVNSHGSIAVRIKPTQQTTKPTSPAPVVSQSSRISKERQAQQTFWDSYRTEEITTATDAELAEEARLVMNHSDSQDLASSDDEGTVSDEAEGFYEVQQLDDNEQQLLKSSIKRRKGTTRNCQLRFAPDRQLEEVFAYQSEESLLEELGITPEYSAWTYSEDTFDEVDATIGDEDDIIPGTLAPVQVENTVKGHLATYQSRIAADFSWGQSPPVDKMDAPVSANKDRASARTTGDSEMPPESVPTSWSSTTDTDGDILF